MKDLILFLKSKQFKIHFIISVIAGVGLLWIAFKSLSIYTHHGESIPVPDFYLVRTEDVDAFISGKNIKYQIVDSVFDSQVAPGVVIKQDPEKNATVKQNRTIYLTVSAKLPPLVKMPNLVDASMRQALTLLESYGLNLGKRTYKPDPCVNCVLSQSINNRKAEPGSMVPKGSVIDLVLGQGEDGQNIDAPCVTGLSKQEATEKLAENGFSEGFVRCIDCKTNADKEKAKVFKQSPPCSEDMKLDPGSRIDLYTSLKSKISPADTSSMYEEE